MVVKVAINGYGTIGKRVADAVARQDDMQLIGVSKTRPNFEAFIAVEKGYPLYASETDKLDAFTSAGFDVAGTMMDMLKEADVVVDATPEGMGAQNLENLYKKVGIRAIFEGGEKHIAIGSSFNAYCNYEQNFGKQYVRVVSCNTTGLCRTLYAVNKAAGIKRVRTGGIGEEGGRSCPDKKRPYQRTRATSANGSLSPRTRRQYDCARVEHHNNSSVGLHDAHARA